MSSQKLATPPCRARSWLPPHVEPGASYPPCRATSWLPPHVEPDAGYPPLSSQALATSHVEPQAGCPPMSSHKLAALPCRATSWLPPLVEPDAGCRPRPRLTPPRSCQPFHLRTCFRVAWALPCLRGCRMLPRQPSQDSGGRNGTSASSIRDLRVNLPSPRSCDLTPVHCFVVALSVTSARRSSLLVSALPSISLVLEDTSASVLNVESSILYLNLKFILVPTGAAYPRTWYSARRQAT
jgi:hypothetical protein